MEERKRERRRKKSKTARKLFLRDVGKEITFFFGLADRMRRQFLGLTTAGLASGHPDYLADQLVRNSHPSS
jgi:hypothetical protein